MADLSGPERARYVQSMFAHIAHRYDLMNRLMTFGQDVRWRAEGIRRLTLHPRARLLDLGAGTGDLAFEALRQRPDCRPVAADFTLQMMSFGQRRPGSERLDWVAANAMALPFPNASFDAVVSGFLLRNVEDISAALGEQHRTLKPGGWISGSAEAYRYLPDSTQGFLSAEALAERMISAGFSQVGFRRLMFGTVAIHWGVK